MGKRTGVLKGLGRGLEGAQQRSREIEQQFREDEARKERQKAAELDRKIKLQQLKQITQELEAAKDMREVERINRNLETLLREEELIKSVEGRKEGQVPAEQTPEGAPVAKTVFENEHLVILQVPTGKGKFENFEIPKTRVEGRQDIPGTEYEKITYIDESGKPKTIARKKETPVEPTGPERLQRDVKPPSPTDQLTGPGPLPPVSEARQAPPPEQPQVAELQRQLTTMVSSYNNMVDVSQKNALLKQINSVREDIARIQGQQNVKTESRMRKIRNSVENDFLEWIHDTLKRSQVPEYGDLLSYFDTVFAPRLTREGMLQEALTMRKTLMRIYRQYLEDPMIFKEDRGEDEDGEVLLSSPAAKQVEKILEEAP